MTIKLIPIDKPPIRLGQFLKLADLAQDGVEAKILIQQGEIFVNGHIEYRRGRQLHEGDIIEYGEKQLQLITSSHDKT